MRCSSCMTESDTKFFSEYYEGYFTEVDGRNYCKKCATKIYEEKLVEISRIPVTTTNSIDGYLVKEYISIESVEIVLGTGPISEFTSTISDFFGKRSTAYEEKLLKAKRTAMIKLKQLAYDLNGNAIIGVDIDFTEFSGDKIGVIVSGTVVRIVKENLFNEDKILSVF